MRILYRSGTEMQSCQRHPMSVQYADMEKKLLTPGILKFPKPHTAEEIAVDAKKRLSLISKEFAEGLKFVTAFKKSVTFFGSSVLPETDPYYQHARALAEKLSKLGYVIVTGGGPGIMEAANRGAYEAGRRSVGLNIRLPHEQRQNSFLTDFLDFHYFFSRKVALTFAAEAYIFFPGGFGTLNEFFEIAMLMQTGRLVPVPLVLVGGEFWNPLDSFLKKSVGEQHGMADAEALSLYMISDDDEKIIELIKKTPVVDNIPFSRET